MNCYNREVQGVMAR